MLQPTHLRVVVLLVNPFCDLLGGLGIGAAPRQGGGPTHGGGSPGHGAGRGRSLRIKGPG